MGEFIYSLGLYFSGELSKASSLVLSKKVNQQVIEALILEPLPGLAPTETLDQAAEQAVLHLQRQLEKAQTEYHHWLDLSNEKLALVVNSPLDLQHLHLLVGTQVSEGRQKLRQISSRKYAQLLTKRSIDLRNNADSPLIGELGAQGLRFKYMLPYLPQFELGDNLFETCPAASLSELQRGNANLDYRVFNGKRKRESLTWDGQQWAPGKQEELKENIELLGFTASVSNLSVEVHEFAALLASLVALNIDEEYILYQNNDPLLQHPPLKKSGKKNAILPFRVRLPLGYRLLKQRFWQHIYLVGRC